MPADRRRACSGSPFEPVIGFSRAVRAGDRILVSGTGPVGADDSDPATQMRRCIEIAERALAELGAGLDDVIRTRIYLVDAADWEASGERTERPSEARVLRPRWSW